MSGIRQQQKVTDERIGRIFGHRKLQLLGTSVVDGKLPTFGARCAQDRDPELYLLTDNHLTNRVELSAERSMHSIMYTTLPTTDVAKGLF